MALVVTIAVLWAAVLPIIVWFSRRTKRAMSEFAAANGFPEDPVTSDIVHFVGAVRYLIPLPVWVVLLVVLVLESALLVAVAHGSSEAWGAPLLGAVTCLGVYLQAVRSHVVLWSPDRLVLVATRIHGRIIRVVSDAFCSQCKAVILPALLGMRFLLETPGGSWRLKAARRGRPFVERLVAALGTPYEAQGEQL